MKDKTEGRGIKTTLELPEPLWRRAKIRAMDERTNLRSVVIRALEAYLGTEPTAMRGRK